MPMSARGTSEGGYILLDVLVALMVAAVGFGSVFSALKTAANWSVRYEQSVIAGLEERNGQVDDFAK